MNIEELLPQVKKTELEILCVIDKFCKEHNLKYSLAYGTMIGAVRHQGFIPWDDDIDLWMPRKDYEKFVKLWLANPVDGYLIQNTDLEPSYTQNFTKIRKNNTVFVQSEEEKQKAYHKGVFVDIFPLDRVAKSSLTAKLQKIYAIFTMLFYRRYTPPTEIGAKKIISKFFLAIVPKSKYENARKYFEKRYLSLCGDETCPLISNSTFRDLSIYYDADMLDSYTTLTFEGKDFMSVAKWDHALTKQYGDYMQLPPEEDRTWKHHPVLIDLEHNYEDLV